MTTTIEYTTDDTWQAAYLLAVGIPLVRVESRTGYCIMVFDDTEGRATAETEKWMNGNPSVPARSLLKAQKHVYFLVGQARRSGVAS